MSEAGGAAPAPSGWWRRRVLAPILVQLRQGITPEQVALTLALGSVLAVFPILGSTTLLCGLAAWALRLNQPVIQLVNYLLYPLQLALLLPLLRAGEWFGAPHLQLSIPQMAERFRAAPLTFIADHALIALGGIAAWAAAALPAAALLYLGLGPLLRRLAASTRSGR